MNDVAKEFAQLGCDAHVTEFGLVAVDTPPHVKSDHVLALLDRGKASGRWDFDLGVQPK